MENLKIGKKITIGKNDRCCIIAEVSANHGQKFKKAVSLIKEAKKAGADAIKFQAYTPESLTLNIKKKPFLIKHSKWGGQSLYELYKKAFTPRTWFKELKNIAEGEGITFFATAFDRESVDFLEELDVPFHKIASFELVDLALIEYIAKTKKPVIMSTGMANLREITEAVGVVKKYGQGKFALLRCVSSYPANPKEMNLKTIPDMKEIFKCPVGLSDHSLGSVISQAAVSLGADIIEKHFTLSRKIKTSDSFFSIEPKELKSLIRNIRTTEASLGEISYGLTIGERKNKIFRRSLFAIEDIKKGEKITYKNIGSIRPGYGISPKYLKSVIGKCAGKKIKKGTPLKFSIIK